MTAPAQHATHPDRCLAERAAQAVRLVADRLAEPAAVAAVAGHPDNRDPVTGGPVWEPLALSHGYPGVALFYAQLQHHEQRWAPVAHAHLAAAVREMPRSPANGLYLGPASVLAAAQTAAGRTAGYAKLRDNLVGWIAGDQHERIAAATARRREAGGVSWADYDVINGLTGTARVLLDAAEDGQPGAAEAVDASLRHLVEICAPRDVAGVEVPGWWVPPELEPVEQDRRDYPQGDFNLGMAHGISGPLMLFALATERGWEVPGQRDAMVYAADWLTSWTLVDDVGEYWPCRVSLADQTAGHRPRSLFTRTAWCYGAPGIAVALHRAGAVLDRPQWRELAVAALRAALDRDERRWHLDGPTLCHGYAGVMHILHRLGTETGDAALLAGARRLGERVLDQVDEDAPFGFRHLVPDSELGWRRARGHRALDVAGVLEGAAGIGCALLPLLPNRPHTGGDTTTNNRAWDRVVMCS